MLAVDWTVDTKLAPDIVTLDSHVRCTVSTLQYLHYSIHSISTLQYAQCVDTESECSHQVCRAAAGSQASAGFLSAQYQAAASHQTISVPAPSAKHTSPL